MSIETVLSISAKTELVKINDVFVPMQVDTGASVSIISTKLWNKVRKPKLSKCIKVLEAYDGHKLRTKGEFQTTIETNENFQLVNLIVVESPKDFGLLGRDTLNEGSIHGVGVNAIADDLNESEELEDQNPELSSSHATGVMNYEVTESSNLQPLNTINGVIAKMELVEGATNKFCAARPVPLAIEQQVDDELNRLQKLGIITPISASENASPVVWVRKNDNSLRMCADFKVHVNSKIKSDSYPMPNIEHIFSKLKNANHFAKIDLRHAYWQIELDKNAKDLSVINTTKGLFRMNRLQMGMKNASAIFQRTMESILKDIKGLLIYQDDIAVFASDMPTLEKRLNAVKNRLREKNVAINHSKCVEYANEISFLGFKISSRGIEPDNKLVQKIRQIEAPKSHAELQQFLGLINYFGRLIPNFSKKISNLNKLRNSKEKFAWSIEHNKDFENIKMELCSEPLVKPYDLNKEVILATDASKTAIGAILTQEGHPVIYVSRSLSKSEMNYSNIERESLAVVWATMRLKHFLLGRQFLIQTDHKPLEFLFDKKKSIPDGTSSRIIKWAIELMPYDFSINYVKGTNMAHADAMSRLKFASSNEKEVAEESVEMAINSVVFEKAILDMNEVTNELQSDPVSKQILNRIKTGNWQRCSEAEKQFHIIFSELTIEDGMIYKGTALFVPPRLRRKAFDLTHYDNHSGVQSSINKLRLCCWWPGMNKDVTGWIQKCSVCSKSRPIIEKCVNIWPKAKIFERLHMDWAYISEVDMNVLIIVDSFSGWIEAFPARNRESKTVIESLRTVFTRFGVPEVLVSDNGKEFKSNELNHWLQLNGIRKMESPVYSPWSNGTAERAVQTVKNGLKAYKLNTVHSDFKSYLQRILFHHRVSTVRNGKSPAEHMFGRRLRVPIVNKHSQGNKLLFNTKVGQKELTFLMPVGNNTSWLLDKDNLILASNSQLSAIDDHEDNDEIENSSDATLLEDTNLVRRSQRDAQQPKRYIFEYKK